MNREDFKNYVSSEIFGFLSKNGFIDFSNYPNLKEDLSKTTESIYLAAKKLQATDGDNRLKRLIEYEYPPEIDTIEGYFFRAEKYRLKHSCSYYDTWVYMEKMLNETEQRKRFSSFYDFSVAKSRYVTMQNNELSRL